jgi:hypothetical protein
MAVPFEGHVAARRSARHHVQVRLVEVGPQTWGAERVRVTGTIARVFRQRSADGPSLQESQLVAFDVGIYTDRAAIPPDAGGWLPAADVRPGRFMEVYLNGDPPECVTALAEYRLIDAPSVRPQLPVSGRHLPEVRRSAWRIWRR